MPRVDTKAHQGTQFYHSQYNQYLPDSASPSPQQSPISQPNSPSQSSAASSAPTQKKKHVCPTCDRAFTTSGHLARHSRVHTGERNHKCPFPGCETRCSRQDNLQQHYRIHLSPGSRRSSARSAIARAMNNGTERGSTASSSNESSSVPPPPLSPPALEPARVYTHPSPPPDSPPPLAQATLPATAQLHDTSSTRSSSSSPEMSYSSLNHNLVPLSPQNMGLSASQQAYSYRSGTTTYQEQSQGAGFTYVHTTPISHPSSNSNPNSFSSYSGAHHDFAEPPVSHLNNSSLHHHHQQHRDHSPVSISSRHSISHISHPQSSYSHQASSHVNPPSPASSQSVSSHTSGPPTPTYTVFHEENQTYHGNGMITDHGQIGSQSHLMHNSYPIHTGRFDSPPPTLAPIQDERFIRRDDRHSGSHHSSPYIHHPQPLPTEYPYHQSLHLGHGAWKAESGMRKGLGALVQ